MTNENKRIFIRLDWIKLITKCWVFIRAMIVVMRCSLLSRRRLCHMSGVMWSCMGTSRCSDRRTWSCLWSKLTPLTMSSTVVAIILVYAPITLFCILICIGVLELYSIYNMHIITVLSILPPSKHNTIKETSILDDLWWRYASDNHGFGFSDVMFYYVCILMQLYYTN